MTAVQFADGNEPIAIGYDRPVDAWLHARIEDTTALSAVEQIELAGWLASLGIASDAYLPRLLVARDVEGQHWVRLFQDTGQGVVDEVCFPVDLNELPGLLRAPRETPAVVEAPPEAAVVEVPFEASVDIGEPAMMPRRTQA